MTVEKVKNKLKSVRNLKVRLMALRTQIAEFAAGIDGVSAVDYSKEKVKYSNSNYVEDRYIKLMDRLKALQDEYKLLFAHLCAVEDELSERMKRLNHTEYQVVFTRYLNDIRPCSLQSAARKFGYSLDGIKTIQKREIKKMADF